MITFDYYDNLLKRMRNLNNNFETYKFNFTKRNNENIMHNNSS